MGNVSGFFLLLILITGFPSVSSQETQVEQKVVLFSSDSLGTKGCYRIPALCVAPNGELLAVADERIPDCGDLRTNRNINLVMRRSVDGGENWGPIERIIDFPEGQSASDASLITDRINGEILLLYNYMDLDSAPGIYRFHQLNSKDNGKTWSKPEDITAQIIKTEWENDFMFITSGGGIQTHSGKLLHCLVNLQRGVFVIASDDHGKSWYLIETPIHPADESKIAELDNGSWMINARVNNAGYRYVYRSFDQGLSWAGGPDSTLPDPGCNAVFIRQDISLNGKKESVLLLSNPDHTRDRVNLTLRISSDNGNTWEQVQLIHPGSAAYSALEVIDCKHVGVLYEADEYKTMLFTRIRIRN
ncbi:MAG: sialidase family protein [Bacteroidales bacterium]